MLTSILSFLIEVIVVAIVYFLIIWVLGLIGLVLPAIILKLFLAIVVITLIIRFIGVLKGSTTPWISL